MDAPETGGAATLSGLLGRARHDLKTAAARGQGGRAALQRFSDEIDDLLRQLFARAAATSPPARRAAVFALGGYGRRQLSIHSDIDLLVLFDGAIGGADEAFVRAFLHPLWDLSMTVGHQVRALGDFRRLETDNPEFLLALLDARLVAGEGTLFDRFRSLYHTPRTHAFVLEALLQLIDERHAQFNATLYQLQPDVKDSPGGLRDVMSTRAIERLVDPTRLRSSPADAKALAEAEDLLLRIRAVLHLVSHRNQNVLSHELQEKVADTLGYTGAQPQQRVERFMSDYFRAARTISRSLERARKTARPDQTAVAALAAGPNLELSSEGIGFTDLEEAARRPDAWLRVFQAAITYGAPVADDALLCIEQHLERYTVNDFFPTAAGRAELLTFLKPRAGLYGRLSQMHECGLLGRVFPEFQAISCRVVRDFYHKYTVDEHTLLAIGNIERLATPSAAGRGRFASLLEEIETPELLVLALLFHDVGKWRDDDHALESVRMAQQMLDRLDLAPAARATVEFLIREHLKMSLVAFRRDTEDPEIVRQFADLVGSEERLKMLCLLTLADVDAVGPGTLTPWKEELLWRLYVDAYNQLTIGYGDDVIDRGQADLRELQASLPPDLSEAEITGFLEGLPRRYLRLFSREAVYGHIRLLRNIHPGEVHLSLEQKGHVWELTVATLDKPFLFSNISGVLSSFGMDILRGHALTNPNGLVLDVFQFTDEERFLELNPGAKGELYRVLEQVVSGGVEIRKLLRGREQSVLYRRGVPRFSPTIHCDNESSERYTILDIIADDALGLLYRISRVISQHGCDVDLVLISTEGKKAIDVFHITQNGAKLSELAQRALADDLLHALEGHGEAH